MRSRSSQAAAAGGSGHAGGTIHVPLGAPPESPQELARLTQAERAERALQRDRSARQVPIDRAFLEAALDPARTLETLVAAVVPRLADWCWVDLVEGDGAPRRAVVAHADPAKAPLAEEMRALSFGAGWATPSAQAMRDRAPRLFRELTAELMTWATHDERHLAVLRAMRPNSLLAVPLVARDRVIGAVTLIRSAMLPALDEEALRLVEDVTLPAALALDDARWCQAEHAARAAAEELADRERAARLGAEAAGLRLRRLESLTASLASVLPPEAIARVAVENGLSLLEPSSAAVVQADRSGERLELLHAAGWPDDEVRELRSMRADAPALVAEAFRIQTALWLSTAEALAQSHPSAAKLQRRAGERAWAAVPLRVDGRTAGALVLGFARPRELDAGERSFVLAVAQLVAQALERARLRDG